VRETLQAPAIHEVWEKTYRTTDCERFYEKAFDWIIASTDLPGQAMALDIGCGIGQHSIRMARRGLKVVAADFSADRVMSAHRNVEAHGVAHRVHVRNEDLEEGLSFSSESFDLVLCWGVLMHVPNNEKAMSELIRVTKVGGKIILYEANLFGLDAFTSLIGTILKAAFGEGRTKKIVISRYGLEYWTEADSGDLMTRHTRFTSLRRFFAARGCRLEFRVAGQFTEQFSRFRRFPVIQSLIHVLNLSWFSLVRAPHLAHGNLLVFEKVA
jgi:2-polyprenyl-3-methyl-5-hydroxy-6-metoxy-1,4-benzoquinol methylase